MNVTQLIEYAGYAVDEHTVQTADGYLLSVQRMRHSHAHARARASSAFSAGPRPAVVLQHGLLDCSATWVMNSPAESLGFLLVDAGFDVWLSNVRGNTYARRHVHLNTSDPAFWAFSFDDMAHYDVPAVLAYVKRVAGVDKVAWVGHSQGTMVMFAASSLVRDVIARDVSVFVALGPVAYMSHVSVAMLRFAAKLDLVDLLKLFGEREFLPSTAQLRKLFPEICDVVPSMCSDIFCLLTGCDKTNLNATRYEVYVSIDPAGTSVQNMEHYAQGVDHAVWGMLDFGSAAANQQHYGQPTPPLYKLADLPVPTALFSGGRDPLADPADVARMLSELPASMVLSHKQIDTYAHMDFVWGVDANKVVYADVIDILRAHA